MGNGLDEFEREIRAGVAKGLQRPSAAILVPDGRQEHGQVFGQIPQTCVHAGDRRVALLDVLKAQTPPEERRVVLWPGIPPAAG